MVPPVLRAYLHLASQDRVLPFYIKTLVMDNPVFSMIARDIISMAIEEGRLSRGEVLRAIADLPVRDQAVLIAVVCDRAYDRESVAMVKAALTDPEKQVRIAAYKVMAGAVEDAVTALYADRSEFEGGEIFEQIIKDIDDPDFGPMAQFLLKYAEKTIWSRYPDSRDWQVDRLTRTIFMRPQDIFGTALSVDALRAIYANKDFLRLLKHPFLLIIFARRSMIIFISRRSPTY